MSIYMPDYKYQDFECQVLKEFLKCKKNNNYMEKYKLDKAVLNGVNYYGISLDNCMFMLYTDDNMILDVDKIFSYETERAEFIESNVKLDNRIEIYMTENSVKTDSKKTLLVLTDDNEKYYYFDSKYLKYFEPYEKRRFFVKNKCILIFDELSKNPIGFICGVNYTPKNLETGV